MCVERAFLEGLSVRSQNGILSNWCEDIDDVKKLMRDIIRGEKKSQLGVCSVEEISEWLGDDVMRSICRQVLTKNINNYADEQIKKFIKNGVNIPLKIEIEIE